MQHPLCAPNVSARLLPVITALWFSAPVTAVIISTGDIAPTYNGVDDPWVFNVDLVIGDTSSGSLLIESASVPSNNRFTYLGRSPTGEGTADVLGAGSVWGNNYLYVGHEGGGSVTVEDGGSLTTNNAFLGNKAGSHGTVTITGAGSTWTNSIDLAVGQSGDGTLNIDNGAVVDVGFQTSVGASGISNGVIHFNNGTLNTAGLVASQQSLMGVGTINTMGLVGDVDLLFDATSGLQKQIVFNSLPGQNVTVNLNASSSTNQSTMGAGFFGNHSLTIMDGRSIVSRSGMLGVRAGSVGTATVDGPGSVWRNDSNITVGLEGTGHLNVLNGASVSSRWGGWLGWSAGASGTATISGAGSTWTVDRANLIAGYFGDGVLTIEGAAVVSSDFGFQGYWPGASGSVTVSGAGSQWNINQSYYIAKQGVANLLIEQGGRVSNYFASIAEAVSATGTVSVSGPASVWDNESLIVGERGSGVLNIVSGGVVNTARATWVERFAVGDGVINFNQGTLNTGGLLASPDGLLGTGTINTGGLITDMDLVFDATTGLRQQIVFNNLPGQNVTVNLDATDPAVKRAIGAGFRGVNTTTIAQGVSVTSEMGYIGVHEGSVGTVDVIGPGSAWTNTSRAYIGDAGTGTLNVSQGATVESGWVVLGNTPASQGVVEVSGPSSAWSATYSDFGWYGDAVVNVRAGATLNTAQRTFYRTNLAYYPSATASVTITGAGTSWNQVGVLTVGREGTATIHIQDGAVVNHTNTDSPVTTLGEAPGSHGMVSVIGQGSLWDSSSVFMVGDEGDGTLEVIDGGVLNSYNATIAFETGSLGSVRIAGAGSVWNNEQGFTVGYRGGAELLIESGGVVNSGVGITNVYIGSSPGATGTVTVDGPDSRWDHVGNIYLVHSGAGVLRVTGGAEVTCKIMEVASGQSGGGAVDVRGPGSKLTLSNFLQLGIGSPVFPGGAATLNISGGGRVDVAGWINIGNNSTLRGDGQAIATAILNKGVVSPGDSGTGVLMFTGNYTQDPEGTLAIELAGVVPGTHFDVFDVTGDVVLNGTLDISMLGGFVPGIGDRFEILTLDGVLTGTFDGVQFPEIPGIGMGISYSSNSVSLYVGLRGDLDGDGFVGIADLNIILPNWNHHVVPGGLSAGDVDGDGFIGITDLNAVLGNWNAGTPPPAEVLALVPEPAAVCWLGVGLLGVMRRKLES